MNKTKVDIIYIILYFLGKPKNQPRSSPNNVTVIQLSKIHPKIALKRRKQTNHPKLLFSDLPKRNSENPKKTHPLRQRPITLKALLNPIHLHQPKNIKIPPKTTRSSSKTQSFRRSLAFKGLLGNGVVETFRAHPRPLGEAKSCGPAGRSRPDSWWKATAVSAVGQHSGRVIFANKPSGKKRFQQIP